MTKSIKTYKDLLDEKERLQSLLKAQKEILHDDFRQLKQELEPVREVISFAGKLVTRDKGNLALNIGANTLIDIVVKKLILSKAGWITKNLVPFFLKNYSSHIISDNKGSLLKKLFSWVGKKNANGRAHSPEDI
jgi:hypothetical protein